MKISYRREMKHNYMIIDPEEITWRGYECQMMESNVIEGLLRFHPRQSNGEMQFYYEITSRQPLERLLENRMISGGEIRKLVIGISNILDQIERFLLSESSILLKPAYIYIEPDSFRIWLCLVPGLNQDFPEAYGKLLEYILGKVNHQDKDCVVLAYGLYQETRKENYGMEDILRLIQQNPMPEFQGKGKSERLEYGTETQITQYPEPQERDRIRRAEEKQGKGKRDHALSAQVLPANITIWTKIKSFFGVKRKNTQEEPMYQLPWQAMFMEEAESVEAAMMASPEPQIVLASPFPSSDFTPTDQGTVLLSDTALKETVRKLRAMDSGEADITISYYPFIIGKQENLADYVLNHETVSRLHLRIDRIGEDYQVMDLNSTNGTVVRGTLLENNEAVLLYPGDEIQIARYRFRFE